MIMFIPIPTGFIYAPLFLASFILSIIAMSQGRIASGITLLLANVIGGPVLFVIAVTLGIATWSGALDMAGQRTLAPSSITTTNMEKIDLADNPNAAGLPADVPDAGSSGAFLLMAIGLLMFGVHWRIKPCVPKMTTARAVPANG